MPAYVESRPVANEYHSPCWVAWVTSGTDETERYFAKFRWLAEYKAKRAYWRMLRDQQWEEQPARKKKI